jgi:Cu/Ag efflux pump CusA
VFRTITANNANLGAKVVARNGREYIIRDLGQVLQDIIMVDADQHVADGLLEAAGDVFG